MQTNSGQNFGQNKGRFRKCVWLPLTSEVQKEIIHTEIFVHLDCERT